MRASGAWVVVALVVGLGVGYWIGSAQRDGDPAERAPVDALDAGARSAPPTAPREDVPPADDLRLEGDPSRTTAVSEPTLAGTAGTGAIRGRVVDKAGAPIAGVQIIAVPTGLRTIPAPPP